MFKAATIFLMATMASASDTDSFNVKLKFLRQGGAISVGDGVFAPASDDNLGTSCDPFEFLACVANFQCEHYDRSIDVFSKSFAIVGLNDVTIETNAPYAISMEGGNNVALVVGNLEYGGADFCTGYNGFQSTWCNQVPNVPEEIESKFWNGGASPGAGSTGWGSCEKCSTCYVSTDMFGANNCDYLCDGYDASGSPASAGTNAKNGAVVGLLCLALTSLSLFVNA